VNAENKKINMTKKVFVIHGWEGYPGEGWFPWLKRELENKGFWVQVLSMPNPAVPKIDSWIFFLKRQVGKPNKNTYFVGHSVGCQTIMRYLENLPENIEIGGVVFIAGFFNLVNLGEEEMEIMKPWLETSIDTDKILNHTKKIVAIFSDNDDWVPLEDSKIFKNKLGAKIIVEHSKGHFSRSDNILELPVVLNELLRMAKNKK